MERRVIVRGLCTAVNHGGHMNTKDPETHIIKVRFLGNLHRVPTSYVI